MTLQDALESKYVEIKSVCRLSEKPSLKPLPTITGAALSRNLKPRIMPLKLMTPSSAALAKQLPLKNILGEFSILIFQGELCCFRMYCSSKSCIMQTNRWEGRSFPFDCGMPYKSGDYTKVINNDSHKSVVEACS